MPNRLRILEAWNSFRREVLPAEVSEVQLTETRRAFYAGAISSWAIIVGGEGIWKDEAEGFKVMDELKAEFDGYQRQLEAALANEKDRHR